MEGTCSRAHPSQSRPASVPRLPANKLAASTEPDCAAPPARLGQTSRVTAAAQARTVHGPAAIVTLFPPEIWDDVW